MNVSNIELLLFQLMCKNSSRKPSRILEANICPKRKKGSYNSRHTGMIPVKLLGFMWGQPIFVVVYWSSWLEYPWSLTGFL